MKNENTENKEKIVICEDELIINNISPPKDVGYWGWIVCLSAFLVQGIIFGTTNSSGITFYYIVQQYADEHNESYLRLSLASSICIGAIFMCSPITSIITDKFGVRRTSFIGGLLATIGMILSSYAFTEDTIHVAYLCITYGLVLGVGCSFAYTPSLVILGHYFEKKLGIVNGIATAGSSAFTVMMPVLLPWLFKNYGIRITFQLMASMMAILVLCSLTFIETTMKISNETINKNEKIKKSFINKNIWHNKKYIWWIAAIPIALFGYFVPYIYIVTYVKQILPDRNAEILVTVIGAFSGIGRIVFGRISDYPKFNPIYLQQLAFYAIGSLTLLLIVAKNYLYLIILCAGFGVFDGCFISLIGPIAHNFLGQEGASQGIGFLLGLCSIPLTIGPPAAGYLYDISKSYKLAFILAGIPPFIGASLMFAIFKIDRDRAKTIARNDESNADSLNILIERKPILNGKHHNQQ